jgi:hypothetical protein
MTAKFYAYKFVFRLLLCSILFCLALGASASPKYRPVEVWCVGDDGLTTRLRDTLEDAFKSSSDFRLSAGEKPGTLTVTITSNVDWKLVGKRTQVFYTVKFSSADNPQLGSSAGSCWEDSLSKCASNIIRDAKTAALKIH